MSEFDRIQKSLTDYLDTKRSLFPRFYFISEADLLSSLQPQQALVPLGEAPVMFQVVDPRPENKFHMRIAHIAPDRTSVVVKVLNSMAAPPGSGTSGRLDRMCHINSAPQLRR